MVKNKKQQFLQNNMVKKSLLKDKDFAQLPFWTRYKEYIKFLSSQYSKEKQKGDIAFWDKVQIILSLVQRFCLAFDDIALGIQPFFFETFDEEEYFKHFSPKEQATARKALRVIRKMRTKPIILKREIKRPFKYVFWIMDNLVHTVEMLLTIANIFIQGTLTLLVFYLRLASNISWREKKNRKRNKKHKRH